MSLAALMATGTKVWLDGVEPDEIEKNRAWGITGEGTLTAESAK